jgi:hypothetical protein
MVTSVIQQLDHLQPGVSLQSPATSLDWQSAWPADRASLIASLQCPPSQLCVSSNLIRLMTWAARALLWGGVWRVGPAGKTLGLG